MKTKQLLKTVFLLIMARMRDLESMDQHVRNLSKRIDIQRKLLGHVVELQRDRFAGNESDFDAIAEIIDSDDTGEEMIRGLNRYQSERDQLEAMLSEFKELLEGMPDDE